MLMKPWNSQKSEAPRSNSKANPLMNTRIHALLSGIFLLGACISNVTGQQVSPDAWGVQVTSANGVFAGAKYYLILTGVGGYTDYETIGISGISGSSGSF